MPCEEGDLFDKLENSGTITGEMKETLYQMRGFRNILVHEYAILDDRVVYETARERLDGFQEFSRQANSSLHRL